MTALPPLEPVKPGPVAWMVRNRVTPNLLMLVFLVGGFINGDLTDEKIEDAASYFNVSPLLVESTLVNKGVFRKKELSDSY